MTAEFEDLQGRVGQRLMQFDDVVTGRHRVKATGRQVHGTRQLRHTSNKVDILKINKYLFKRMPPGFNQSAGTP